MALWDGPDLLARVKLLSARDKLSSDASMTDPNWYSLLTEAQAHWYSVYAAQVPYVLMGAPTALSTSDSGATYTFGSGVTPLAVEVYDANYRLMRPGAFWDATCDYVWEGVRIRFPKAISKPATYRARWIAPPAIIDATPTEPTLVPAHTRILLVYHAVAEWANRGGMRDPAPFWDMERRAWMGDYSIGDVGILGALKQQNFWMGAAAVPGGGGIMDSVSTGAGYTGIGGGGG